MIVNNADLVTHWPSQPSVPGALVAIEGKSVVDFGPVGKLVSRYDADTEVLDVGGRLLMPGLVDAACRLHRSIAPGLPIPWGERERIEAALDEETLYWSALAGLLDALRSGVTTLVALVSSPAFLEGSLAAVSRALEETRMRGAVGYVVSPGPNEAAAIAENRRHAASCRGPSSDRIRGLFGLDPGSMEDQALARFVEAAEAEGALCHVAVEDSFGEPSIVKRLDEAGVWNLGGVLLHRGPMAPGDEALLANREVWVAHAASSDMLARKGTPDLSLARSSGVRRALATDEGGGSLSESMRVAAYRQRSRGRETRDAVRLVCDAAFEGGASLATRVFGAEVGRVKPGARADLVVFDYRPLAPLEGETLPEQVLWGALSAPVHSVIVNGRLSYQNGEFRGLDEERIRARAREAAKRVRERR